MPHAPERSTNQLAVWWRLVEKLYEVAAAWQQAQEVTGMVDSRQLPANLAVELARSGAHGAEAAAGVAAILAQQIDSGGRSRSWPAGRVRSVTTGQDEPNVTELAMTHTNHNGLFSRWHEFDTIGGSGGRDA